MAKKLKDAPQRKPTQQASPAPSVVVSVRVSAEFRAWLDRLVASERMSLSDVFDRAIVDYARKVGFPEAAPQR